ncbi:MAG: GIY-YIG nuclease family protein [Verrucomicrobiota bacterium]|jgi:hypothetical protein
MKRKPKTTRTDSTPALVPKEVEETLKYAMSQPPPPYVRPKEYIYLTKSDFGYKIGRTTNPDKRPLSVAGNMPIKLTVITVIEVPDSIEAERRIHGQFAEKRLRGEWFSLDEHDVGLIKGYPETFENLLCGDVPF